MAEPVAWSFAAAGDCAEQLEWLTDSMPAPTGGGQLRPLRESPRHILQFDGQESGHQRRWMETRLRNHGTGHWWAPVLPDVRTLASTLASGSDTVSVDTDLPRFQEGGYILLIGEDPQRFEVIEVEGIDPGTLTLATDTTLAWPAGTRIMPVRLAKLRGMPTLARYTSDDTTIYRVEFRLEESLDTEPDFGAAAYRGQPVLELKPVWTSDPTWSPERQTEVIDNEISHPLEVDMLGMSLDKQTLQFALVGLDAIAEFRGLLFALKGRCTPLWVPTWASDLRVVAGAADGATTLDVEGPNLSAYSPSTNRQDLRIELHDGTVHYRRILTAVVQTAGVDRLTLDVAFVTGFAAADVALVSFLAFCRQDSDVNLLRYFKHDTVQCELTFRGESHDL